jgi:hypothetical protein
MIGRFDYVEFDDIAAVKQLRMRMTFEELVQSIERSLPDGRARALAITKIEEAFGWLSRAIRDEQLDRQHGAGQPARGR